MQKGQAPVSGHALRRELDPGGVAAYRILADRLQHAAY